MKKCFLAVLAALVLAWPPFAGAQAKEFTATVIRVTDGDTLVVRTADFEDLKIRLYGIDAPESRQEGGAEATEALRPLQGRQVTILDMGTDRYSRTVGLVEYKGQSVNLGQVVQGWAWHYVKYCQDQPICGEIEKAEAKARAKGIGLWKEKEPTPPWEWRKMK